MRDWIHDAAQKAEALDAEALSHYFTPDAKLHLGHGAVIEGQEAIAHELAGFFKSMRGIHHEPINDWEVGDTVIVEAKVSYAIPEDRGEGTVRGAAILTLRDEHIAEARLFRDLGALLPEPPPERKMRKDEAVDEAMKESFPASDAPAHSNPT